MTTMVKQRFDGDVQRKDCFLCCAVMAAGADYDAIWSLLDDQVRTAISTTGAFGNHCNHILELLKFERMQVGARTGNPTDEPGDYYVLFILPEYATTGFLRNMLWGRRALIQVPSKNYKGEQHIIYWDGAALFDPSNLRTYQWHEVEPIYLWLFNERNAAPAKEQD